MARWPFGGRPSWTPGQGEDTAGERVAPTQPAHPARPARRGELPPSAPGTGRCWNQGLGAPSAWAPPSGATCWSPCRARRPGHLSFRGNWGASLRFWDEQREESPLSTLPPQPRQSPFSGEASGQDPILLPKRRPAGNPSPFLAPGEQWEPGLQTK